MNLKTLVLPQRHREHRGDEGGCFVSGACARGDCHRQGQIIESFSFSVPPRLCGEEFRIKKQRGFTLLELLVAIMIFAIMSALAYSALRQALDTREYADKQAQRLAELQKAMTILSRDIEQAISRPVRDPYSTELPAMQGGGLSSSLLELTRAGWRNPAAFTRSNLQRVSYQLSENKLLRHGYAQLDRAFEAVPDETPLLGGVKNVTVRFLNVDNQWLQYWPPAGEEDKMRRQLPKALELVIELEDWGSLKRILRVAGG